MKYAFYAFIIAFFATTPSFAQEKGTLSVTTSKEPTVLDEKKPLKTDSFEVKKQKIQAELTLTIERLGAVIARTQIAIDLLLKVGRDTTEAQQELDIAKKALIEAQEALALLDAPVVETTQKKEVSLRTVAIVPPKNPTVELRDQVKKVQDALKVTQSSLIDSITALKQTVQQKNNPAL